MSECAPKFALLGLLGLAAAGGGCAARLERVGGADVAAVRSAVPEFNEEALRREAAAGITPAQAVARPGIPVSFDDPLSVLAFVVASAPERAVVYPSERYYYYTFPAGPRMVSGNIRFSDVERGVISVGYFDAHHQPDIRTREFEDGKDGVRVRFREDSREVLLAVGGIERTFVLDQEAFEAPVFPLLEGEELVSGIRDESGYFLHLIYWRPERAFYYVLNPTKPLPETWSRGGSARVEVWWGDRSRFCFVREPRTGRFILVGVHQGEIRRNTRYDGPFDQVPPNLPIRAMLEEAYPYVVDAGGLDDHGNFLKLHGQRVAISPYQEYVSGPQFESLLEDMIQDAPTPRAWTRATYESKRDWRPPVAAGTGAHVRSVSAAWPANHWGPTSRLWGADHQGVVSSKWPPNHELESSRADR
ncbi:MAG: hypothetical protein IBJ11_09695 [Phycisphaerales bacterium]|nr:hypothetical protein [Phycisphaerales bacterium]